MSNMSPALSRTQPNWGMRVSIMLSVMFQFQALSRACDSRNEKNIRLSVLIKCDRHFRKKHSGNWYGVAKKLLGDIIWGNSVYDCSSEVKPQGGCLMCNLAQQIAFPSASSVLTTLSERNYLPAVWRRGRVLQLNQHLQQLILCRQPGTASRSSHCGLCVIKFHQASTPPLLLIKRAGAGFAKISRVLGS